MYFLISYNKIKYLIMLGGEFSARHVRTKSEITAFVRRRRAAACVRTFSFSWGYCISSATHKDGGD